MMPVHPSLPYSLWSQGHPGEEGPTVGRGRREGEERGGRRGKGKEKGEGQGGKKGEGKREEGEGKEGRGRGREEVGEGEGEGGNVELIGATISILLQGVASFSVCKPHALHTSSPTLLS